MNTIENNYALKGEQKKSDSMKEFARLNFQNALKQYRIGDSLKKEDLNFLPKKPEILDLGFGGGFLSSWLSSNIEASSLSIKAVDINENLLNHSLEKVRLRGEHKIKGIVDSFLSLDKIEDESQDAAITRYTAQHVPYDLEAYFSSVFKKLKKGGKFLIIDGDGISSNLRTTDQKFNQQIIALSYGLKSYSPQIVPLIYPTLKSCGFEIEEMRSDIRLFITKEDLKNARRNWKLRFELLYPLVFDFFGSKSITDEYMKKYQNWITMPNQMMYFTQFGFVAKKLA